MGYRGSNWLSIIYSLLDLSLGQEVIISIIVQSGEFGLCIDMPAKRITVAELLQSVQTAGNSLVTILVEGIEIDGCSSIDPGVEL